MKISAAGTRDAIHANVFLTWFGQFPQEPAYVETAGGVAHQGERVARLEFASRDPLGQVLAETARSRNYSRGGEVIEVVQDRADCPRVLLPRLELPGDSGEVFQLTEGVEPRKSRH